MRIGIIGGGAAGLATRMAAGTRSRGHPVRARTPLRRSRAHHRDRGGRAADRRRCGFQFFGAERGVRDVQPAARRRSRSAGSPTRRRSPSPAQTAPGRSRCRPLRAGRPVWPSLTSARDRPSAAFPVVPGATFRRFSRSTTPPSRSPSTSSVSGCRDRSSTGSCSRSCWRSGASMPRTSAASPRTTPCTTWARTCRRASDRRGRAQIPGGLRVYVEALVRVPRARDLCTPAAAVDSVTRDADGARRSRRSRHAASVRPSGRSRPTRVRLVACSTHLPELAAR